MSLDHSRTASPLIGKKAAALVAGLVIPGFGVVILMSLCSALPLQDLPEHAHMASVIAHGTPELGDSGPAYKVSLSPTTYVATFWVWRVLSLILSPEAGGRALLVLYAIGCAAAVGALLRRIRPGIPLIASLAIGWWVPFSFFYYMGFLPYLFAVPVVIVLMFHLIELLEEPKPVKPMIKVIVDLVLLYLLHPLGIAVGVVVVLTLPTSGKIGKPEERSELRANPKENDAPLPRVSKPIWWRRWAPVLLIAIALLSAAGFQTSESVKSALTSVIESRASGNPYTEDNWVATIKLATRVPAGPFRGPARKVEWLALSLLGAALVWSLVRRQAPLSIGGRRAYSRWILVVALMIFAVSYVMASLQPTGTVYHRLFIYPWFFLLIGLAARTHWRRTGTVLVLASAAVHLTAVTLAHSGFHREAKPARELMAQIPADAVVLPLLFNRDSRVVYDEYVHVFQHIAAYHPASTGGVYLYLPDHAPLPVRPMFPTDGLPALAQPWRFRWTPQTRLADYILLRGPKDEVLEVPIMKQTFDRTIALLDSERNFIKQSGRWGLWGPKR